MSDAMGIRVNQPGPQPQHRHRKGKPCYACIEAFEIECGIIPAPQRPAPPKGRGSTGRGIPATDDGGYIYS